MFTFLLIFVSPHSLLFLPAVEHKSTRFLIYNHSSVAVKLQKEQKTHKTVMKVVHILYLYNLYVCIPSTTRCTSLLFILIFIKSHILFLHILFVLHILLFCTLILYSIAHFTFNFLFNYIYALVWCYFYIIFFFYSLHCPLSGPDSTYISLLIIPCIIYHVTNKETLTLTSKVQGQKDLMFLKIRLLCLSRLHLCDQ